MTLDTTNISKGNLERVVKKFSTLEESFNLHHNNKFDYSNAVYTGVDNKIKIICPTHGEFEQTPYLHLKTEFGCATCAREKQETRASDTLAFVKKAKKIHANFYNYSNTIYNKSKESVTITCPIHGDFEQTPNDHLQKCGCPACGEILKRKKYFSRPTTLYYVYIEKADLYKVGITIYENPLKRFSKEKQLGIQLLWSERFSTGKEAYTKEQAIIQSYQKDKYTGPPIFSKGGESECFIKDILNKRK